MVSGRAAAALTIRESGPKAKSKLQVGGFSLPFRRVGVGRVTAVMGRPGPCAQLPDLSSMGPLSVIGLAKPPLQLHLQVARAVPTLFKGFLFCLRLLGGPEGPEPALGSSWAGLFPCQGRRWHRRPRLPALIAPMAAAPQPRRGPQLGRKLRQGRASKRQVSVRARASPRAPSRCARPMPVARPNPKLTSVLVAGGLWPANKRPGHPDSERAAVGRRRPA